MVFKIIRDGFAEPNATTRQAVIAEVRARLPARPGRAPDRRPGIRAPAVRPASGFTDELLSELLMTASRTVSLRGDHVVNPAPLRGAAPHSSRPPPGAGKRGKRLVRPCSTTGKAIRDLAATNIFPGDISAQELRRDPPRPRRTSTTTTSWPCSRTVVSATCPPPRWPEQELDAEPWYYGGPQRPFSEEFIRFPGPARKLRECFLDSHASS
jgi:isocitrate dehydrogenase kinase/phosphatase